ncbi:MAG: hypothetical protein KA314_04550 [Chloroflexi bacterium]|nr:hypothetical protein [Chloroflexota bacterium]
MSKHKIQPLKITFEMDTAGIIYDPLAPPMLDSLIDWSLSPMVRTKGDPAPGRGDLVDEIRLPLGTWHVGSHWGWCASALIPAEEGTPQETIQHFRKKFRANRISLTNGVPNLQSGATREYNLPFTVQLVDKLVAYCLGDRHTIDSLLRRNVHYLGQKKHRGRGRVESIAVEVVESDYSLVCDGKAMRWLPVAEGLREVRLRPPYWNNNDRVPCCEVGDAYAGEIHQP